MMSVGTSLALFDQVAPALHVVQSGGGRHVVLPTQRAVGLPRELPAYEIKVELYARPGSWLLARRAARFPLFHEPNIRVGTPKTQGVDNLDLTTQMFELYNSNLATNGGAQ